MIKPKRAPRAPRGGKEESLHVQFQPSPERKKLNGAKLNNWREQLARPVGLDLNGGFRESRFRLYVSRQFALQ